jgi:curved DNA-binding protein CbpA
MDAYAVIGVTYTASPLDIRKAFRYRARQHHPDRFPLGSPEQHQATQRMAALNTAYQLIRDSPLRHHRISTGARPEEPWTDEELDAAVRRSRSDIALTRGIAVTLSALGLGIYLLLHFSHGLQLGPVAGFILAWLAYFLAVQTPAGLYLWETLTVGTAVLRRLNGFR